MSEEPKLLSLDLLASKNSGFEDIAFDDAQKLRYQEHLGLFLTGQNQKLYEIFLERPDFMDSSESKALMILNKLSLAKSIRKNDVFVAARNEALADAIARDLVNLLDMLASNIKLTGILTKLKEQNFFDLSDILPSIVIYYSDFVLNYQIEDLYEELFNVLTKPQYFQDLYEENLRLQRFRLLAYYYRRTENPEKAEEAMQRYRENFFPNLSQKFQLRKIENQLATLPIDLLDNLEDVFAEISEIQTEVSARTGIYPNTCFYYNCADCCKKDYPIMSYTEYMFFKNWLKTHNVDIKPIQKRAEEIQKKHQELHGFRLAVVKKSRPDKKHENPHDFKFDCPLLVDDACSIHQARPLACRAYGLSTINAVNVQACSYYLKQYQYNASHQSERHVYDVRPLLSLVKASDHAQTEKDLQDKQYLSGTFVAWLTDAKFN